MPRALSSDPIAIYRREYYLKNREKIRKQEKVNRKKKLKKDPNYWKKYYRNWQKENKEQIKKNRYLREYGLSSKNIKRILKVLKHVPEQPIRIVFDGSSWFDFSLQL